MTKKKRSYENMSALSTSCLERLEQRCLLAGDLMAGDANQDYRFDEADFILAFKAGKFETSEPANWAEGDWNGAPGGTAGDPPAGDGIFDSSDFVVAFVGQTYLTGPYSDGAGPAQNELAPVTPDADNAVEIFYESLTGNLRIESDSPLSTFHLFSQEGVFLGPDDPLTNDARHHNLFGLFDNYTNHGFFKLDPGGFSSLEFTSDFGMGVIIQPGLSDEFLSNDLRADGAFITGGGIGEVSFNCIDCVGGDPASVSGDVFDDLNRNGIRDDGEPGISGVPVQLESIDAGFVRNAATGDVDINQDGNIDPVTERGKFAFNQLPSGRYRIGFAGEETAWLTTNSEIEINLGPGEASAGNSLAVSPIVPSSIEAKAFQDDNENGSRDEGEPYLNGLRVTLLNRSSDSRFDFTTEIDSNEDGVIDPDSEKGLVKFENLRFGDYEVSIAPPTFDWNPSGPSFQKLTLAEGEAARLEVGFVPPKLGDVMGQVFDDVNKNGVRDAGETGLNGWRIQIGNGFRSYSVFTSNVDLNGDGEIDLMTETGIYLASGIVVDEYSVFLDNRSNWISISPENGTASIEVTTSETAVVDFANHRPAAGDFNLDESVDANDIALLCAAMRNETIDRIFDMNGDRILSLEDLDRLIRQMGSTVGDANLDGKFDSADLVTISQAGEYEDDIVGNSTWAEGDWNCDGEFDAFDLVRAFRMGGYSRAAISTVDFSDVAVSVNRFKDVSASLDDDHKKR